MTSFVVLARCALRTAAVVGLSSAPAVVAAQSGSDDARLQPKSARPYSTASSASSRSSEAGAPASLAIEGGARRMMVGATVPHSARVRDAAGAERRDVPVKWTSSDPSVASVNQFGVLTAVRPGPVTVRAVAGSLSAERRYTVEANVVKSLTLSITDDQVKTGDVVEVSAMAFDASGYKVPNVPFLYTFTAAVEDSAVGQLAPAELDQRGRFVAQKAGDYQIIAVAPGLVAHRTVRVSNRDLSEVARVVARVATPSAQLSDVTGWRGRDGRDYAIACASGARGQLVSFEVSDAGLRALDTVAVDAKSVSDCAVDPESGIAAVVREGANGRTSIALFDANDPRAIKPLGSIDDGLGAVSGVAIAKRTLYAVSDSRRLDILSLEDAARPRRVGSLDLGDRTGASGASDVSVADGIAYVALGRAGVALVDVGSGKFGGSAAKPVRVGGFRAPFASTHAAYGYRSRTAKWYVITSEDLGGSSDAAGQPGFARIVDFTDPTHPEEVARYEVPEAGVQDLWIDGERLYVAAQNGGVRVVDISADLKGNLYHQGREVARFAPADAGVAVPNVVAVQPVHGAVLAADRANGVWLLRLAKDQP
ncbi:MAG TPA: Ig-like domain-containing protein [Gemmatimonadaceae bacterium]|nr:Ig-like domain-containing protein [Gemmatimonadaceae bacterium]